jgi:hypothetical protein
MNSRVLLLAPLVLLPGASCLLAQDQRELEIPPPVVQALPLPASVPPAAENQRLYPQPVASMPLVPVDTASGIIGKFHDAYGSSAAPRIVVYVNRALVDIGPGFRPTGRTEKYEKTADNAVKTTGENTYQYTEGSRPALADQQTVRDIERLFGRVFRNAGAKLADEKVAIDLLAGKPGESLASDQAARERETLMATADIAIEVLISSRNVVVPGISSDQVIAVPDIQATAIRLKDAAIIGQASATDVLGKGAPAGSLARTFDVSDVTEATALALMEDMLTGAK